LRTTEKSQKINNFDCDLSEDFFKAFDPALSEACGVDTRAGAAGAVPSSKGVI